MRTALASCYSAGHLGDAALRKEASDLATGERVYLVQFLVRIAEIDVRKLYRAAGFASMLEFCIEEYSLTEDEALKRLQAARAARDFPALFVALDEGRICLNRVRMLAPHLTPENMIELLRAAERHHRLSDFRQFLNRFTKPDLLMGLPASSAHAQAAEPPIASGEVGAKEEVDQSHARGHVSGPPDRFDMAVEVPMGPPPDPSDWVTLRVKAPRARWEHLRHLLSHSVPSGDATKIFLRMLDATIEKEEKRKFAACKKPRGPRPGVLRRQRTIPAHVRRAVVERDGGQCTFVSESGRRCTSRRLLEYDHVLPVAQGGQATVEGIRLRCRPHNQYEAEQAFGAKFMAEKREEARRARAGGNPTAVADRAPAGERFRDDVIAGLRALGVRDLEVRDILERSGALQRTTLEASMRAAMRLLGPRRQRSA